MEIKMSILKIRVVSFSVLAIFLLFLIANVSAETIIINPDDDPFSNQTNDSSNDTPLDRSAPYLANVTDETLKKLIEALVRSETITQEEREYLKAILEASREERRQFQEALAKLDYAYKDMIEQRNKATTDKEDFITTTKVRMETLETEVDGVRADNVKLKAWVFFYIFMGLAFGVLTIELAGYLKRNQKMYFVVRWIRDHVPIKF